MLIFIMMCLLFAASGEDPIDYINNKDQNVGCAIKGDWPERKPTPHQSNPDFDFMGQLPDLVIGKNERAKLQIPRWLKKWEMEEFNIHCEEINYKGDTTA
jgi:hypothetical protein